MSKHYTFYIYVTLIVALIFSIPSLSFAEQHQAENIRVAAKWDAERDANRDTSKVAWFTAGMVPVCLVSAITMSIAFNTTGGEYEDAMRIILPNGISPFVGPVAAILLQPHPPVERFIGKSPEYISAYTGVYKSKTRLLRTRSAMFGVVTGCGVSVAGCLFILLNRDTSFGLIL